MHRKSSKTQKARFYRDVLLNDPGFEPLFSQAEYVDNTDKLKVFKWKCKKCGDVIESRFVWGNAAYVRCLKCDPIEAGTSKFEKDIASSLRDVLPSSFEVLN